MTNTIDQMDTDPAKNDLLILVDGLDRQTGTATKLHAHTEGLLHRAFSIVLTRAMPDGIQLLLSQRSRKKYHSGGLWANSCCSHPRNGEELLGAARRRLAEELGCGASDLHEIGAFAYRAEFDNGLCEHEYDHVLVGRVEGAVRPNPDEIEAVRWTGIDELATELSKRPDHFAVWAPMVLSMAMQTIATTSGAFHK